MALFTAGRYGEASELAKRAAEIAPQDGFVWKLWGASLQMQGKDPRDVMLTATLLQPEDSEAHHNLGIAEKGWGLVEVAVVHYRRALVLTPALAEAHSNLATALYGMEQVDASVAHYHRSLVLKPDIAEALCSLGNALRERRQTADSIASCRRALATNPYLAMAYNNLGTALRDQGHLNEGLAAYHAALCVAPDDAEAGINLGISLKDSGRLNEAVAALRAASRIRPDHAAAHSSLGATLSLLGRPAIGVTAHNLSLSLKPDYAEAHCNRGADLPGVGRFIAAIAALRWAIRIKPDFAQAYSNLGCVLKTLGRFDDAIAAFGTALRLKPDYAEARSNLLMALHYHSGITGSAIVAEARRFALQVETDRPQRPFANDADPDRKLRIGYVSPDFRQHSVAWFFEPLLDAHDRQTVEIFCYADVKRPDALTERLRIKADHWRNGVGLSDLALAQLIRQDRIDILVDLAGHTADNRLRLFADKAAPVQVSWLGYPGTTGLSRIDYRLVDAITDPTDEKGCQNSETLLHLADGFLCYAPPSNAPLPGDGTSPSGLVTFGSFNNPAKLSSATLDAWAALLARLPGTQLLLKGRPFADPATRADFVDRLQEHGIHENRLTLLGHLPATQDHLALYHQVDIALDPFPYNGTTTSCEALWMGVPVVTLRGDRHSGRVGASILHRLGLDDMIAETVEDYIAIAAKLASDTPRRRALRRSLRDRMAASPLCDAPRFAKSMEAAYRGMWRTWCYHLERRKEALDQTLIGALAHASPVEVSE